MSPLPLRPLTDCTKNYRPILSSERAPQDEEQSNCPAKERKKVWSWVPKGCRTPTNRRSQHELNSTLLHRSLASYKRLHKGNPVVSDETVMYGYESSATLTTDRLHYKLQTHPLVREGTPRWRAKQSSSKRKEKKSYLVMGPKGVPNTKTEWPADHRS
jgi:hypothetical protein